MEEDQEHEQQKHVCKYCDKQFPCGRSLGGHMRSHMRNEKTHKDCGGSNNSNCNSYLVDAGYGLRENPKKTWRLSDSVDDCFKLCKECGKGFQSWKALCGHMRCHSERERVFQSDSFEDEEEDDDSWNHKLIMDSHSDTETAAAPRRRKRSRRARYNNKNTTTTTVTVSSCLSFANASTCVSEIEQEQEEVAICLMMLSRDVGYWGGIGFNSLAESSDNNSSLVNQNCNVDKKLKGISRIGFKKPMGDEEEGFEVSNVEFGKRTVKCTEAEAEAEIEMGEESWKKLKCHGIDSPSKSRYQCTACNKTFHSYQALGGHRASHKRMKGCFVSKTENGETSIDNNGSPESKLIKSSPIERERPSCGEANYAAKKNKHECPVCHKVFASGQALGGHKRSHVLEASEARLNQSIVVQKQLPEIRDLLDLNLPAPDEEDTTTTARIEFKPWWIGNSHQHGPAVGMIFN